MITAYWTSPAIYVASKLRLADRLADGDGQAFGKLLDVNMKEDHMRTRHHFDVAGLLALPRRRHAVVVGGSLAGMLAARVLSDHFNGVTLLERDRFPETPAARRGPSPTVARHRMFSSWRVAGGARSKRFRTTNCSTPSRRSARGRVG